MLNSSIGLHDTTVDAIVKVGRQVIVLLRAYVYKSEGRIGIDAGSGWIQAAVMTWTEATIEGVIPELSADIWRGDLVVDGVSQEGVIPIPFSSTGAVALSMHLNLDSDASTYIEIHGSQAILTLLGEELYVEEVPAA